jgi:UDP-N-acetylmuramate--alanine ligase
MLNATAALAVADVLGLDVHAAAEALSSFEGVRRRFTHVGDIDGVTVVDDYGHHPTEVAATLSAAKDLGFDRVVVCFQPHRYSRTQTLAPLFAHAFDDADVLLVMDVFSAGEMPIPGISGKTVAGEVSSAGVVPSVSYVPNRHDLIDGLVSLCKPGDLLITMGAGDVTSVGPDFIRARQEAMEDGSSAEGDDALAQD